MKYPINLRYRNYVAIEGSGEYPKLFCPVCGMPITFRKEACPHLLFAGEYGSMDGQVTVDYVHPKLNKTDDALGKELSGTQPTDLASKLNFNRDSTFVLSVESLFNGPLNSDLVHVVAAIEFPPCSDELTAWKRPSKDPIEPAPQPAPQ